MSRACRIVLILFGLAYLAALGLLLVGTLGLFGNERDPLAGLFLLPLGIPWIWLTGSLPDTVRPWAAMAAPAINLLILYLLCTRFGSGRHR